MGQLQEESFACDDRFAVVSNFAGLDMFVEKRKKLLNGSLDLSSSPENGWESHAGIYYSPVTQVLYLEYKVLFQRLLDTEGPPQRQSVSKTPSQGRTSIRYKFSSDLLLRELYMDPWNGFRVERLLEDLDIIAGVTSAKHCDDVSMETRPSFVVTASLERMVLKKPIPVDSDLILSSSVIWVGRSSLETQVELTKPSTDGTESEDSVFLICNFLFVARDSKTGKSATVNRLIPETEKEKRLEVEAEARDAKRRKERERKKARTEEGHANGDCDRVKTLVNEGKVLLSETAALEKREKILLKDTQLENGMLCQPLHRNMHGRIFGGYLMHRAYETAFATCHIFVGQTPYFVEVNHIDFLRPVDVGDFVHFKSCVLYTKLDDPKRPLINVEVISLVTKPKSKSSEVSNKFYFTFTIHPDNLEDGLSIPKVLPSTEEEARHVLERFDADTML